MTAEIYMIDFGCSASLDESVAAAVPSLPRGYLRGADITKNEVIVNFLISL